MTITAITAQDAARAALYQRVSTDDQDTERQNQANRETAAREHWAATEYTEKESASRFAGRSGGANRAEWSRLLADLAAGQVDVLVLWEPSRGDRQVDGWSALLTQCRRTGTLIHITSHGRTYDPANARDRRALLEDGVDSEYESEKISARITAGKAYWRQQRGQDVSGRPLYGVRRVNADRARNRWERDEPHPDTAPVVARIVAEVAAGRPLLHIARDLTADGIPTSRGGTWNLTTVSKIAARAEYVALGIVTEADSLAARERLARSRGQGQGRGERPARQTFRYSGCLACAVCGEPVRGTTRNGMGRYVCGVKRCVSIPSAPVDAWVDARVIDLLARPELFAPLFADADSAAAETARTEARAARQAIADAAASYAAGKLPLAALETVTTSLQAKAEAADRRAQRASTPGALAGLPDEDRAVAAARWDALTVSARKAAIRAMAPRAQLRRGRRGRYQSPVSDRVVLWPGEE